MELQKTIVCAVLVFVLLASLLVPPYFFAKSVFAPERKSFLRGLALWAMIIGVISFVVWLKQ